MAMTVEELARRIGAQPLGDEARVLNGCAGLQDAGPEDVSFLANRKYLKHLLGSRAGAVIISPEDAHQTTEHTLLVAEDPYFAFREAVVALRGFRDHPCPQISDLAYIHPSATIGRDCVIEPFVYIGSDVHIGDRCVVYPHCYIGPHVTVGEECLLFPNVTIYDQSVLGRRVTLHAGCVIGHDGFGYATHKSTHHKIPQVGNVVIEDDVELGANCAVARATVGSTVIGRGTKFSDLVVIGHGTRIGPHNLLVAQVGVAGSTVTGDSVVIGGQAGVAGHLHIGAGAQLAGRSGVKSDLEGGQRYGGLPAMPWPRAKRVMMATTKLPQLIRSLKKLWQRVDELEAVLRTDAMASGLRRSTPLHHDKSGNSIDDEPD